MLLNEIFGFGKKEVDYSKDRGDITADERARIDQIFADGSSNAKMKDHRDKEKYLFPGNVTLYFWNTRMNIFKHKDKLQASVGFYRERGDASDPKKSPVKTVDYDLDTDDKMKKLRDLIFNALPHESGHFSADQMRHKG